ncbi:hypothetical protein R3P38DRAFT_3221315 [Favolaschia claudopus]|uniref:Uncharacterized protein n=1 Tax=Favolaschia claudopus TaxID=2862362 RepID=A0AAW0A0H0_9AGAR
MSGTGRGRGRGGTRGTRGGRGRGGGRTTAETPQTDLNDSGKRAADGDDLEVAPAPSKKKKKPSTGGEEVEPRKLPHRVKRVQDPGKPDQTAAHRTAEEIEEERAEKAALTAERERRRNEALKELAQINLEQAAADAEEESRAIDTIEDLHELERESVFITKEMAKTKGKKSRKSKKLETRAAIDDATAKLAALQQEDVAKSKKAVAVKSAAAADSKQAGLSKVYRSKFVPTTKSSKESPEPAGLEEEDAESTRPNFEAEMDVERPRLNQLISISGDDSEYEDTPTRVVPAPRDSKSLAKPRQKRGSRSAAPALTPLPTLKLEASSSPFVPDSAADIRGLPALVGATWETRYLPAAYRALYCSDSPMTFALRGDTAASKEAAVAAIQAILDSVHPGNSLKLCWDDEVCKRTVARVREERSDIIAYAFQVVEKSFQTKEYLDQPIKIRDEARYASRPDGPAFHRVPTPRDCPCDPTARNYIKPVDYLETKFIIATVAEFLKNKNGFQLPAERQDKKYDFSDMPRGLFALAAAGVERAFKVFAENGQRPDKLEKFTISLYGTSVASYIKNIARFTRSRWESLLLASEALVATNAPVRDASELDDMRDYMYVPSSPS